MKTRLLIALVVLMVAAASCDSGAEPEEFTNRNARYNVAVGDEFRIVLEANVTTGYTWDFEAELQSGVLELIDRRYEAPVSDRVGSGGREVFDLRAIGDGTTFIQLWYIRPFDDPPDPADHAQFEVIVGTSDPDRSVDPAPGDQDAIGVAELLARGNSEQVAVRGLLFDDGAGLVLCEVLAESCPPQCVGARVPIANPAEVEVDFAQQGAVRWCDQVVVLTGTLADGFLTVVTSRIDDSV